MLILQVVQISHHKHGEHKFNIKIYPKYIIKAFKTNLKFKADIYYKAIKIKYFIGDIEQIPNCC